MPLDSYKMMLKNRHCLREATIMTMPSQMRQLFATLMLFQMPADIRAPFDEFKQAMSEDYVRHDQLEDPHVVFEDRNMYLCLWDIDRNLRVHGKSIRSIEFSELPQLPENYVHPQDEAEDVDVIHKREQGAQMLQLLNNDQLYIHNTVMEAVQTASQQNCYFVDGPAGTGKTFLYNTLVHNLQGLGIKVKCVAYSEIASTLLQHTQLSKSLFHYYLILLVTLNVKAPGLRSF